MGDWKIIQSGSTKDFADDFNFKVEHFPGGGMAPVNNVFTNFALLDGSTYQRTRAQNRVFSLTGTLSGSSVSDLHLLRKNLIDVVKPDKTSPPEATVLQYTGAGSTLQGSAFYDAGLEFGQPEVFSELQIGLRFVMPDPYWENPNSTTCDLATQTEVANANRIIQRSASGAWQALLTGASTALGATIHGLNWDISTSLLYISGAFTSIGGCDISGIATWNGSDYQSLGASAGTTSVNHSRIGADGTLYAQYDGTAIGGISSCDVASYDGVSWSSMDGGLKSDVTQYIEISSDDRLYAMGQITGAGASIAACRIAYWEGGPEWVGDLGASPNNGINVMAEGRDGLLYMGGNFTSINGSGNTTTVSFDSSASLWAPVGGSANSQIHSMGVDSNNIIYMGGRFSTVGNETISKIAQFNGTSWESMGTGLNGSPTDLKIDNRNNNVYVGGDFTEADGLTLPDQLARWTGSRWVPVPVNLPGTARVSAINIQPDGTLTLGYNTGGTASAAGVTTIVNDSTATAYPIISASGPGRLYELVNYTTGDEIYFDLTLNSGEVVTLDLRTGEKTFKSDFRGNIISAILATSNLSTWKLLPGNNNISLFIDNAAAAATMEWTDRFWSLDGGA